jgi:predicted RNase H-like HicB family nuclease/DNA-binding XRE family transcriptional regulator
MHYHFRVHEEDGGFWARSMEKGLGITTQGDTLEELKANISEALNLALDEPVDSKWIPPMPGKFVKARDILVVGVDPSIALATMIRVSRLKNKWPQRTAAEHLGIKHLRQYQLLESGKSNPELATLVKIKRVFPKVSIDAILMG